MNKIISPGELTIGMHVTVFQWNKEEKPGFQETENMLLALLGKTNDKRYCGEVLQIKAVQLPYLAIEVLGHITTLDTRDCQLMELGEDYVKAKMGAANKVFFAKLGLKEF